MEFLALGRMWCEEACPADCTRMFRMLCICVTELCNECSICVGCEGVLVLYVIEAGRVVKHGYLFAFHLSGRFF